MTFFDLNPYWESDPQLKWKLESHYNSPEHDGLGTDWRIIAAIEAITGADILDDSSPAYAEWENGYNMDEIRCWLDQHLPNWRTDSPLSWGAGTLIAEGGDE